LDADASHLAALRKLGVSRSFRIFANCQASAATPRIATSFFREPLASKNENNTGDLSRLCGCSIAAGVGAAVAIVYQQKGNHMGKITFAVHNLISDLGGMLSDGVKAGFALKVVSSADSAIRSAYMALNNHGITEAEGFVGKAPEETIRNLSNISAIGMAKVDDTMLTIMKKKTL
jgi:L-cysteine desulfidase